MHTIHRRSWADLAEQERVAFLRNVADDTEDAPWMTMGDAQFWAAADFASALRIYAQANNLTWYVAGMLPILYHRPDGRRGQVAPDVLVAFVPPHPRQSYDLTVEGGFPAFVLEVLAPASVEHDQEDKLLLYDALGAQEYALFAPQTLGHLPPLQGYRRGENGRFEPWPLDGQGRLWSAQLGLYLVAENRVLRALRLDGTPLLTHAESEALRQQEAAARERAEDELARLRALLDRQNESGEQA